MLTAVCPIRAVLVGRRHAAVQHAVRYKLQQLVKISRQMLFVLCHNRHTFLKEGHLRCFRHGAKRADLLEQLDDRLDAFGHRTISSSAERNLPFFLSSTMLSAACSPMPGMDVNGGIKPVSVSSVVIISIGSNVNPRRKWSCRGPSAFPSSAILSRQTLSPLIMQDASKPFARMEKYAE